MKMKTIVLSISLLLVASLAQASDKRTPEILASVSSDSIQNMTKSESADTRGEYLWCGNYGGGCSRHFLSFYVPNQYYGYGTLYSYGRSPWHSGEVYVSR